MIDPLRPQRKESTFSTALGLGADANSQAAGNLAKAGLSSLGDMLANRKILEGEKALMTAQRSASSGSGLNSALNMAGSILGGFRGSFGGSSAGSGFSLGNSFTKDYGLSSFSGGAPNYSSFWNG
jgi:hypothetical protein